MTRTAFMDDEDPRNVVPLFRNGPRVNRHKDNPLVQAAKTDEEKKLVATALDFREEQARQRAEDAAAEAVEAAKRTFFGKVFHHFVIFTFGMVPDAFDEVVDWCSTKLRRK